MHSKLNIPIFDILTQYERYFQENNNQYDKEADTPEFKVNTIVQLMYALNAGIYALDFTFRAIERDIQTIMLGTGSKGQVMECQKNVKIFQEKAEDLDSLLFAFYVKNIFFFQKFKFFEKFNFFRKFNFFKKIHDFLKFPYFF